MSLRKWIKLAMFPRIRPRFRMSFLMDVGVYGNSGDLIIRVILDFDIFDVSIGVWGVLFFSMFFSSSRNWYVMYFWLLVYIFLLFEIR